MAKTGKQLKELGTAIGDDVTHIASGVKDKTVEALTKAKSSALESAARITADVERRGGLSGIVSTAYHGAARNIGHATGRAGRLIRAAYDAATIEKSIEDMEVPAEPRNEDESRSIVNLMYEALKRDFRTAYQKSTINPDDVAAKFDQVASKGKGYLAGVIGKIRSGRDSIAQELRSHIPAESDYKVMVGRQSYKISRDVLIKRDLDNVKQYVASVAQIIPQNYKGRSDIIRSIAENGIRSEEELAKKMPELYLTLGKFRK